MTGTRFRDFLGDIRVIVEAAFTPGYALKKLKRPDDQRIVELVRLLDSALSDGKKEPAKPATGKGGGGGGSGGVGNIDKTASGYDPSEVLRVANPNRLLANHLIHYAGSTMEYADASLDRPANYVAIGTEQSFILLRPWCPTIDLIIYPETANGETGFLWLYKRGQVTRSLASLKDSRGRNLPGFYFAQQVGSVQGIGLPPPTGMVRATYFPQGAQR